MKIVRRISDGLVIYGFDDSADVVMGVKGLVSPIKVLITDPSTMEIVSDVTGPSPVFVAGAFTYHEGDWTILNQDQYDSIAPGILNERAEKALSVKRAEIQAEYSAQIAALERAYTKKERETWPQQITEARAYQADTAALTPLIDAMLITRPNDTKAGLVQKIITNYCAYCQIVGEALGAMQTKLAALNQQLP